MDREELEKLDQQIQEEQEEQTKQTEETEEKNEEEETSEETSDEETAPSEKEAEEKEDIEFLKKQRDRLYARLKREEKKRKELQKKIKKSSSFSDEIESEEDDIEFWKTKVDFLLQNQDKKYTEEEFEHIATVAARKGISLSEAAKQEEDYIQYRREKVAEKNKVPAPTSPFTASSLTPDLVQKELKKAKTMAEKKEILRKLDERAMKERGMGQV